VARTQSGTGDPEGPTYAEVPPSHVPADVRWSEWVREGHQVVSWGEPAPGEAAPREGSLWMRTVWTPPELESWAVKQGAHCLRRITPPGPVPSPQEVDAFIRGGRIGPGLLDSHNHYSGTSYELADCRFSVQPPDPLARGTGLFPATLTPGRGAGPALVMAVAGQRHITEVGHLWLHMPGYEPVTDAERTFFESCNIGLLTGEPLTHIIQARAERSRSSARPRRTPRRGLPGLGRRPNVNHLG
jgi:hypothetical protein